MLGSLELDGESFYYIGTSGSLHLLRLSLRQDFCYQERVGKRTHEKMPGVTGHLTSSSRGGKESLVLIKAPSLLRFPEFFLHASFSSPSTLLASIEIACFCQF
jgi:hypothetical protein